jgi:hypothetical protein
MERPKQWRGGHLWKKPLLHFSLCFVMGFFTRLPPSYLVGDDALTASYVAISMRSPPPAGGAVVDVGDSWCTKNGRILTATKIPSAYLRIELGDLAAFLITGNILLEAIIGAVGLGDLWTSYLASLIDHDPDTLRVHVSAVTSQIL